MLRPDLAPLDVYLADAMLLDPQEFQARHPWPMLVIAEPDWDKIKRLSRPETLVTGMPRPALYELLDLTSAAASGATLDALCLPLRPKHGADRSLQLGRAPEADVVLLDETISKIHAELRWVPAQERAWLTDLGSRNGTYLDEVRLAPNAPNELTPGAVVFFGSLLTRYYPPSAFLGWLSTGAARAGGAPRPR
jgi:hypothetical protein